MRDKQNGRIKFQLKKGDGRVWANTHRLELWAYLNWCIQHQKDFDTLIVNHLRRITKKKFTPLQIRNKLKHDWERRRRCATFSDIYSQGTAGLVPFGAEDQAKLDQISSRLERQFPQRERVLRSASVAAVAKSQAPPATPRRCPRQPNAPSPQARELSAVHQTPGRWVRAQSLRPERREAKRPVYGDEPLRTNDVYEISSDTNSQSSASKKSEVDVRPAGPESKESASDQTQAALITSMQTRIENVEAELDALRAELGRFTGREITLMNHISKLADEKRKREERDRIKDSDATNLRNTISRLQMRVESQDILIKDFEALQTDTLTLSGSSFDRGCIALFEDVSTEISNFICNLTSTDDLPERRGEFLPLSHSWANMMCGFNMNKLFVCALEFEVPKRRLLASLLTAGIINVVFESTFPEMLAVESPLFTEYQRIIKCSAGSEIARNIELSAKKNIFHNDNIREDDVSRRAKWLCNIVLQSLDVFIPPDSRDMIERSPNKLSADEGLALSTLERGLSKALTIKLDLELSLTQYKYLFFTPGLLFDEEIMKCDGLTQPAKRIKVCITPALFSVPREVEEQEENSCVVSSRGVLAEARFSELKSLVLIAKAKVLL
ncbi:hypothetical protein FBEOM_6946 [Fusarium beomiforme]|uniref:Uncharacterized protein n=1 Tax=Fusarium beomiforme TaxID=44412 RepID=A0A9P5AI41_9HYPO|nr:hypothetical protein FBEOM_6946 [Fusarium beomiforme]